VLLEFHTHLPLLAQIAIALVVIVTLIGFSSLGWRARGPSQPGIFKFTRIFHEPATVTISHLIVTKTATIIEKAPHIWRQIADLSMYFVS
jgi:hypothetical protein